MSDKKEESLRKKAKSNLDPKGWEALLDGVPRIDGGESPDNKEPGVEDELSDAEKHVFKLRDESGKTSEQVTSRDRPVKPRETTARERSPEPRQDRPTESPRTFAGPGPASGTREKPDSASTGMTTGPADAKEALSGKHLSTAAATSIADSAAGKPKDSRFSRWGRRIRKQPAVQRVLRYYQGLNTREQRIVLLGLLFFSGLLIYTFIIGPIVAKNTVLNRKLAKKKAEVSEMVRLQSSVVQDKGGIDRIKKIIEQRGAGFSVFAYLEQLASKAEMKERIVYIKPQRETPVGPFRESLAEIKLGNISLEEVSRFLYQIEASEDLLYVKNLKMKAEQTAGKQEGLTVTLTVGTLLQ